LVYQETVGKFLRRVAESARSVLLLDYDGTLAPFSVHRARAAPYAGVTDVLQRIADAGRTRLVVVTGRNAEEIAPLLGLRSPLEVWGAHGVQRLRPDGVCETQEIPSYVAQALNQTRHWLDDEGFRGLVEMKPGSLAVHWRTLNEGAMVEVRSKILGRFQETRQNCLTLLEFDGGMEIRMADLDKGHAVRTILEEIAPDIPVAYLGDDTSDEGAFQALEQRGLTVLVRPRRRRTLAQAWLKAPEGLLLFLSDWAKANPTSERGAVAPSSDIARPHVRR
jgi:trehalose 6-phosphate phosphatase